jgi:cell wall-associated NlpC family hydrolase
MLDAPTDPRLTAARPDLADARLRGRVVAARYVAGRAMRVRDASAPLRRAPRRDAPLDTEAQRGEAVTVFDAAEGWAWVQLADGYVGYLPDEALGPTDPVPSHRVRALRTFVYPGPNLKLPPLAALGLGAEVAVEGAEGTWARLADGFVHAAHLSARDAAEPDFVAVAERLVGVPYLWGGRTGFGIDCSGLVQLALSMAGRPAPRDADLQERALGSPVADRALRRGDLVFWRGHVGIMQDARRLLHANGHHMAIESEPLAEAEDRILAAGGGPVTSIRRLAE